MSLEKVSIKGVEIYPFTSCQQILQFTEEHLGIMISVNAEIVLNANAEMRQFINRHIGYCDGAGPLMALKKMGCKDAIKIAGCELWLKIAEKYYQSKSFYLVGSKQEVIEETVCKLKSQFPGINILGYRNGYIKTDVERQALIDDILRKKPDVVYVAMGAPRQERLMEELERQHKAIYMGLGGSFDVYTGHVKRAPEWWVSHNVEWLYRLIHQPSRIKRQIKLVKFAWWVLRK